MSNNPFYHNPYQRDNNYAPGASYAPQTGSYMAGKPNYHPNNIAHSAWGVSAVFFDKVDIKRFIKGSDLK